VNLVLLGLRGAGKTTVGRLVAERLGWAFVDLDERTPAEVVALANAGAGAAGSNRPRSSVAEVWAAYGEAQFRAAEVRVLKRVLEGDQQVIALGGGTPVAPGAAELLRVARGAGVRLVYLRAEPGVLASRLSGVGQAEGRPSLTGAGVMEEIPAVFGQRDGLYRELAGVVIESGELSCAAVAEQVAALAT
jgi:shikimate kinase